MRRGSSSRGWRAAGVRPSGVVGVSPFLSMTSSLRAASRRLPRRASSRPCRRRIRRTGSPKGEPGRCTPFPLRQTGSACFWCGQAEPRFRRPEPARDDHPAKNVIERDEEARDDRALPRVLDAEDRDDAHLAPATGEDEPGEPSIHDPTGAPRSSRRSKSRSAGSIPARATSQNKIQTFWMATSEHLAKTRVVRSR